MIEENRGEWREGFLRPWIWLARHCGFVRDDAEGKAHFAEGVAVAADIWVGEADMAHFLAGMVYSARLEECFFDALTVE